MSIWSTFVAAPRPKCCSSVDGEPLPVVHGFPARLVIPGLYGYVSATKWLSEIRLTTWDDFDGYWIPRGWGKEGPIKTQSEGVTAILRSPMTAVHLVTLLEEMPVQETADTIAELSRFGLPTGTIIINNTWPPVLAEAKITQAGIRRGLAAAGLAADRETVLGLLDEARAHQTRLAVEAALRAELRTVGRRLVELPALPDGVTRAGLDRLADVLLSAMSP